MRIEHQPQLVKEFAEKILTYHYEKSTLGRKGWHRSDAIACPLKAYWRITGEVKGEYRSRDVGVLMVGEMAHIVLERGFDAQEKIFDIAGIAVTIDAISGQYPVEIKTTRKRIFRSSDIPRSWIEQVSIAISVMNVEYGYLFIMNIINFSVTVWKFTIPEPERELVLHAFVWQILNVADCIQQHKPELLTPRYEECMYCLYRPSKLNRNCPYYKKLDPKKSPV